MVRYLSETNRRTYFLLNTITGEKYWKTVQQFIALLESSGRYYWFQQNGAPAHMAQTTFEMLHEFFDDRIIARGLWPPHSPDMMPPDFFCDLI